MKFKFCENMNTMVISTSDIIAGKKDILLVSHDSDDGMWEFLDGNDVNEESAVIVSIAEMVRIDDSLNELANLPTGWIAYRESKDKKWKRSIWTTVTK